MVLFIEVFRLILVICGAVAGYEVGRSIDSTLAPVMGLILGSLIAYVVGGVIGRFLNREQDRAVATLDRIPPGELFAGSLTALAGMVVSGALCVPLLALVHSPVVYPAATLIIWVFGWAGFKLGVIKGRQVVAAAGLTRILAPPSEPPPGYALLIDTSAVMDRSLLVFGRAGLLVGGLVVPRFVIDQVHALATSPDPVSSRRARRGLESLEALRELGVSVHVAENELPEINDLNERLLEMCRRLGLRLATCSKPLQERGEQRGLRVVDLRRMAGELTPHFAPGEKLVVDLVKAGNQPLQAVGYLPDGDMVVVNDAAHAIGRDDVVVEVQTTRITGQGLLVFARLADPRPAPTLAGPVGSPTRDTSRVPPPPGPPPSDASVRADGVDDGANAGDAPTAATPAGEGGRPPAAPLRRH